MSFSLLLCFLLLKPLLILQECVEIPLIILLLVLLVCLFGVYDWCEGAPFHFFLFLGQSHLQHLFLFLPGLLLYLPLHFINVYSSVFHSVEVFLGYQHVCSLLVVELLDQLLVGFVEISFSLRILLLLFSDLMHLVALIH